MPKSTISIICKKYGQSTVAEFLNVHKTMVSKAVKQGYAPAEWFYNLILLTDETVTLKELQQDIVNNKPNCRPMVNKKQVNDFLKTIGKPFSDIKKRRQTSKKHQDCANHLSRKRVGS